MKPLFYCATALLLLLSACDSEPEAPETISVNTENTESDGKVQTITDTVYDQR